MGLPPGSAASAAASPRAAVPLPSDATSPPAAATALGLLPLRWWLKREGPAYVKMPPPATTSAGAPRSAYEGLPLGGLLLGVAKRLGRKANSPNSSAAAQQ